jgi:hypothetical protein
VVAGLGWEGAKNSYPEVRRFLQNLGLGARTVFGDDFWVDRALTLAVKDGNVVFPDVRFENEADAIRSAGGKVIRIDRPGHVATGHVSETGLVGYDFDKVFDNGGSIQDLQTAVVFWAAALSKSTPAS